MDKNKVKIELMKCEKTIIEEIGKKQFKRNNVAISYALCIVSLEKVNWTKVNNLIIERWSISGLEYIKKKAWKIIKEVKESSIEKMKNEKENEKKWS